MASLMLINELVNKKGYKKKEAQKFLRDIEDIIIDEITNDNTVTWSGFVYFYMKKYNHQVLEGKDPRFGPVYYMVGVKHLRRATLVVRQITHHRLAPEELEHNEKIQGAISRKIISRRKN